MPAPDLTKAQREALQRAANDKLGIIEPHCMWRGLQRAAWHARMSVLVSRGLLRPYIHGGFEITDAGRRALSSNLELTAEKEGEGDE